MFIAMHGLPGSGKTAVALKLASKLRAGYVSMDWYWSRNALHPVAAKEEERRWVYAQALRDVGAILAFRRDVVLDSTARSQEFRMLLAEIAATTDHPLVFVACKASPDVLRKRLDARNASNHLGVGSSHLQSIARTFEELVPTDRPFLVLETSSGQPELRSIDPIGSNDPMLGKLVVACRKIRVTPSRILLYPIRAVLTKLEAWLVVHLSFGTTSEILERVTDLLSIYQRRANDSCASGRG